MKLGFFAIGDNGDAVVLNEEVLKFARTDVPKVRWYGRGRAENSDLVLYFGKNAAEYINGADIGTESAADGKTKLILLRYEDSDCVPMVKRLEIDDNTRDVCCITDTVFSEENIRLTTDENGILHICINGHEYIRRLSETENGLLLLVRSGKIRYFSRPDCTVDEIRDVLDGKEFSAYIEGDCYEKAENLFEESILKALSELKDGTQTVYSSFERGIAAVSLLGMDFTQGCRIYSIGAEKEYLLSAKEETKIYDTLFRSGLIKIGRNELACEARLKGNGKNIEEINRKLEKVCRKNVTIVLTGESGTGKTFLAKEIHKNSRRADGPFINVNCAAIAYNLIESELFGYEDGAFTGAKKGGKVGYFELAKGGTLFLDEISELPLLLQGKLLEVLQEGTFYRVGGVKKISSDVRLIVATNRNLEKMVKDGQFREDLYYRISVFPIHLPPLRERIDDLYSIIEDTLPEICERLDIEPLMMTDEALEKMKPYQWPGNIRELENVLEKAAVLSEGNFIRAEDVVLENSIAGSRLSKTLKEKLRDYEKELIQNAFSQFSGNRRMVAEYLGISKTNLFEKIHQYGIDEKSEGERT